MGMEGSGLQHITNQLKADKGDITAVMILERQKYTDCTVNFKTYTNSIWDKKLRQAGIANPYQVRLVVFCSSE